MYRAVAPGDTFTYVACKSCTELWHLETPSPMWHHGPYKYGQMIHQINHLSHCAQAIKEAYLRAVMLYLHAVLQVRSDVTARTLSLSVSAAKKCPCTGCTYFPAAPFTLKVALQEPGEVDGG
eukprot:1154015-Pelagomonas_calceolata.AAC.4